LSWQTASTCADFHLRISLSLATSADSSFRISLTLFSSVRKKWRFVVNTVENPELCWPSYLV